MARKMKKRSNFIGIIILIFVMGFVYVKIPQIQKLIYPFQYKEAILKYSYEYNLDPYLIAAVIKVESNFYPLAESPKGARGLMQITPSTGKWIAQKLGEQKFNKDMLFDPELNIKFGCWYIDYLYKCYGYDLKVIFAAYNGGQGNVNKWLNNKNLSEDGKTLDDIPFEETKEYVNKIEKNYKVYRKLYKNIINEK